MHHRFILACCLGVFALGGDTQAALWKGPISKELKYPARSHVSDPSYKGILQLGRSSSRLDATGSVSGG